MSEPSWWKTHDWWRAVPAAALPTASDLVAIGGGITGLLVTLTIRSAFASPLAAKTLTS